jgi:hypothetical protein
VDDLYQRFQEEIMNQTLPYQEESLDELSQVLQKNLVFHMKRKGDSYFYEDDLIQLYVLDFQQIVVQGLSYFNHVFSTKANRLVERNLSSDKGYKPKLEEFKKKKAEDVALNQLISTLYDPFYFYAFDN